MHDESLFGVEKGALQAFSLRWTQDRDGLDQALLIEMMWANRKPTQIVVLIPNEHTIAHYVAIWQALNMNGAWLGKMRVANETLRAIERCRTDGAMVNVVGTRP